MFDIELLIGLNVGLILCLRRKPLPSLSSTTTPCTSSLCWASHSIYCAQSIHQCILTKEEAMLCAILLLLAFPLSVWLSVHMSVVRDDFDNVVSNSQ